VLAHKGLQFGKVFNLTCHIEIVSQIRDVVVSGARTLRIHGSLGAIKVHTVRPQKGN
jgi:hypothetical protein